MIVTYFVKHSPLESDPRTEALLSSLRQKGCEVVRVQGQDDALPEGASLLLSLGGDGTFLDATRIAASSGVPVMGVNLGRMGFLSGAAGDHIAEAIVSGSYKVEERSMIEVSLRDASGAAFVPEAKFWSCALNEVSVMRCGAAMIGIDVSVDGEPLPTYWADGLLVSTSTGSTAYSLSVGGPVCTPDAQLLIIAPVSPHNLNVRPLIVPLGTEVEISLRSRCSDVMFTMDNRVYRVPSGTVVRTAASAIKAKRAVAGSSNFRSDFINALENRLLWGGDIRNQKEND